jgi:hypothetical protein
VLDTGNERPDAGETHLLDRLRFEVGLRQEAGEIEIGFEADVDGEGRDGLLDSRDDGAQPGRQTRRISATTRNGSETTLITYGA